MGVGSGGREWREGVGAQGTERALVRRVSGERRWVSGFVVSGSAAALAAADERSLRLSWLHS